MWHVVGDGAIGMALAHGLHAGGVHVTLAGRQGSNGPRTLEYRRLEEAPITWSCPFTTSTDAGEVERLVLAVKSFSVRDVLAAWRPRLIPGARVVFLQNGTDFLDPEDVPDRVLQVHVVNTGFAAYRSGDDAVVQTATSRVWVGDDHGSAAPSEESLRRDLDVLRRAGLELEWTADIDAHRWLKIAINAVINPLTVLFDCLNGGILATSEPEQLMDRLCAEGQATLDAIGGPGFGGDSVAASTRRIIDATSENVSSMLADFRRASTRHELDYINLPLIRAAERHGVDVPGHREVYRRVVERFRGNTVPGSD